MKNIQLLLINAGLALVISGLLFGLYYSTQTDHKTTLELKDAYETTFMQIVNEEETEEWRNTFEETLAQNTWNSRAIDVHTHAINMGILVMLFGLICPFISKQSLWGFLFLSGAMIYPAGLLLQMLQLTLVGEIIAAVGALLAIGSFAIAVIHLFRQSSDIEFE